MTALIFFPLASIMAASTGAMFKPGVWYETLRKPWWTPPNWAFPIVWTLLYAMIGWAGWIVGSTPGGEIAVGVWIVGMVFNAAWSWIFFGRHWMSVALADSVLMWSSILAFIIVSWPVSPLASMLFMPYLVWVTIATALNATLRAMNPQA